ncbi:hypothetical protein NQB69_24755 (plasmid) [Escherichia coli]|nr:hypothetical protein NQB69_24755 [Escherichia coli]
MHKSINLYRTFFLFVCAFFIATNPAMAGIGGLDKGTTFIGELRIWAYGFVGAVALLHVSLESIPGIRRNGCLVWCAQITDVRRNCGWLCSCC